MAASINDKRRKYKSLFSTTLSTGIGTGTSDTITPATVTGLPTDTAITLTIDRVDSAGTATPSKLERIKGIISGGNLIDYVRGVDGTTEQAHSAGAVVEMVWNAADWNDNVDWGLVQHGQDGVHTSALVTSLKATGAVVNTGTSDTTIVTPKAIADSGVSTATKTETLTNKTLTSPVLQGTVDGWISAGETWTYASADDPTYTFTVAADVTTKYSAGMRIKLTQTTVKYFIITGVSTYSGGNTTITVYGGTDYDLANAAITSPYYSTQKAPQGFPGSPTKWQVLLSSTENGTITTPTQNAWTNYTGLTLSVPIGSWNLGYQANLSIDDTSTTSVPVFSTLSTANNSASDDDFTCFTRIEGASGNLTLTTLVARNKNVDVAVKTSYYLNAKTSAAGIANIGFRGDANLGNTIIRAVCAYL